MADFVATLLFFGFMLGSWLILNFLVPPLWTTSRRLFRRSSALLIRSARYRDFKSHRSWVRDYAPVLIIILLGAGIALMLGEEFLDLTELLHSSSPQLAAADKLVYEWARDYRRNGPTGFFTFFTLIGTPVGLGILTAILSVACILRRRYRWATFLVVTNVTGGLLNVALKSIYARQRPDLTQALRSASGYSFPSGHAMGSAICFGAFAYIGLRWFSKHTARTAIVAAALTVTLTIALSRVYLGVHWISDIGAGLAAGITWLFTAITAYEAVRRIRLIRQSRTTTSVDR